MKMVKKVLMGLAAAAAVLSFVGCDGLLQGDDTEGVISGSNGKYTISYANESNTAYRAYKSTPTKHAGALIEVGFEATDDATVKTSKIGIIFDIVEDKDAGTREFYIIGLNPVAGNNNFYVSKFTNVTDIQADNFGTKLSENPAKEDEIVAIKKSSTISGAYAAGKKVYIYYKHTLEGNVEWAVLTIKDDDVTPFKTDAKFEEENIKDTSKYTILESGTITGAVSAEELAKLDEGKYYQGLISVYAQVAAGATLEGSVNFSGTAFHEAEDAE